MQAVPSGSGPPRRKQDARKDMARNIERLLAQSSASAPRVAELLQRAEGRKHQREDERRMLRTLAAINGDGSAGPSGSPPNGDAHASSQLHTDASHPNANAEDGLLAASGQYPQTNSTHESRHSAKNAHVTAAAAAAAAPSLRHGNAMANGTARPPSESASISASPVVESRPAPAADPRRSKAVDPRRAPAPRQAQQPAARPSPAPEKAQPKKAGAPPAPQHRTTMDDFLDMEIDFTQSTAASTSAAAFSGLTAPIQIQAAHPRPPVPAQSLPARPSTTMDPVASTSASTSAPSPSLGPPPPSLPKKPTFAGLPAKPVMAPRRHDDSPEQDNAQFDELSTYENGGNGDTAMDDLRLDAGLARPLTAAKKGKGRLVEGAPNGTAASASPAPATSRSNRVPEPSSASSHTAATPMPSVATEANRPPPTADPRRPPPKAALKAMFVSKANSAFSTRPAVAAASESRAWTAGPIKIASRAVPTLDRDKALAAAEESRRASEAARRERDEALARVERQGQEQVESLGAARGAARGAEDGEDHTETGPLVLSPHEAERRARLTGLMAAQAALSDRARADALARAEPSRATSLSAEAAIVALNTTKVGERSKSPLTLAMESMVAAEASGSSPEPGNQTHETMHVPTDAVEECSAHRGIQPEITSATPASAKEPDGPTVASNKPTPARPPRGKKRVIVDNSDVEDDDVLIDGSASLVSRPAETVALAPPQQPASQQPPPSASASGFRAAPSSVQSAIAPKPRLYPVVEIPHAANRTALKRRREQQEAQRRADSQAAVSTADQSQSQSQKRQKIANHVSAGGPSAPLSAPAPPASAPANTSTGLKIKLKMPNRPPAETQPVSPLAAPPQSQPSRPEAATDAHRSLFTSSPEAAPSAADSALVSGSQPKPSEAQLQPAPNGTQPRTAAAARKAALAAPGHKVIEISDSSDEDENVPLRRLGKKASGSLSKASLPSSSQPTVPSAKPSTFTPAAALPPPPASAPTTSAGAPTAAVIEPPSSANDSTARGAVGLKVSATGNLDSDVEAGASQSRSNKPRAVPSARANTIRKGGTPQSVTSTLPPAGVASDQDASGEDDEHDFFSRRSAVHASSQAARPARTDIRHKILSADPAGDSGSDSLAFGTADGQTHGEDRAVAGERAEPIEETLQPRTRVQITLAEKGEDRLVGLDTLSQQNSRLAADSLPSLAITSPQSSRSQIQPSSRMSAPQARLISALLPTSLSSALVTNTASERTALPPHAAAEASMSAPEVGQLASTVSPAAREQAWDDLFELPPGLSGDGHSHGIIGGASSSSPPFQAGSPPFEAGSPPFEAGSPPPAEVTSYGDDDMGGVGTNGMDVDLANGETQADATTGYSSLLEAPSSSFVDYSQSTTFASQVTQGSPPDFDTTMIASSQSPELLALTDAEDALSLHTDQGLDEDQAMHSFGDPAIGGHSSQDDSADTTLQAEAEIADLSDAQESGFAGTMTAARLEDVPSKRMLGDYEIIEDTPEPEVANSPLILPQARLLPHTFRSDPQIFSATASTTYSSESAIAEVEGGQLRPLPNSPAADRVDDAGAMLPIHTAPSSKAKSESPDLRAHAPDMSLGIGLELLEDIRRQPDLPERPSSTSLPKTSAPGTTPAEALLISPSTASPYTAASNPAAVGTMRAQQDSELPGFIVQPLRRFTTSALTLGADSIPGENVDAALVAGLAASDTTSASAQGNGKADCTIC